MRVYEAETRQCTGGYTHPTRQEVNLQFFLVEGQLLWRTEKRHQDAGV